MTFSKKHKRQKKVCSTGWFLFPVSSSVLWIISLLCLFQTPACAQSGENDLTGQKIDGYRGIWFTLGQPYPYGDKYSGGLGTYTAKHVPLAIYAPAVNKTFFVYGGTTEATSKHLLCMIGSYDHTTGTVAKPTVVYDKKGVDDPHDNPSLLIDHEGYLWVFVSGRGRKRMGYKYKSRKPFDIAAFDQVSETEMTYPQPWHIPGSGYFHFFTKYTGVRELYFEKSEDGINWTKTQKLAGVKRTESERSGHYQVSNHYGNKLSTFFNWHPNGNVDQRTNLYYLQTTDFGETWTDIQGNAISVPLTDYNSSASVVTYDSLTRNVYLKDINFDRNGNPVCLYITSGGHEPGPENSPRAWKITHWKNDRWETNTIATSDHNYDMGSLFIDGDTWRIVAPVEGSPQAHGGGGEVTLFISRDAGKSWKVGKQITSASPRNHNYVRRVVNGKAPFQYLWADGNPDTFSQSFLYFGNMQGQYWKLPYHMDNDFVIPVPGN
ncbi:BNR-4 repeat-containing protein [Fulvivirgaceae bacterium BMA12]|uniref:BNR-4 repeat-containing protein n=1 Tax=Agaribacillus aureus TaxID=3051825 RepID=A0ABT8L5Y8_9BACT|nr:BNR-4 repeat-containing protein [Fulvivirgaceae bacterium BMA12]